MSTEPRSLIQLIKSDPVWGSTHRRIILASLRLGMHVMGSQIARGSSTRLPSPPRSKPGSIRHHKVGQSTHLVLELHSASAAASFAGSVGGMPANAGFEVAERDESRRILQYRKSFIYLLITSRFNKIPEDPCPIADSRIQVHNRAGRQRTRLPR